MGQFMSSLEAYDYVVEASRECGFEVNGWAREGKVLEVYNGFAREPEMELQIVLFDGFVIVPEHYDVNLKDKVKERAEAFAKRLGVISGQNAVVDMKWVP